MRVFQPGTRGRRTLFAQPGNEFKATSFMNDDGSAKMFTIVFTEGAADVDDQLGQYLIDQGMAARSAILLPPGVTA